ncbi:MAG: HlyD family secretion protein [Pseudomonadota bacterium]|nr:HlyD family secretion protein [Pseudomonadota bacterium]
MVKIYDFWRDKLNLSTIIIFLGCIAGLIHFFSYLFPFTDDAFVVTNTQPVAADVSGYITDIYVKNGQKVHRGDPLFKVFDTPYKLAYAKYKSNYEEVLANIEVIREQTAKNRDIVNTNIALLNKVKYEYSLKSRQLVNRSISQLEIQKLKYDIQSLSSQINSLQKQLIIDDKQIIQQQKKAASLKAEMDNAQVNINLTTVQAGSDGVVDNMYLAVGTPIVQHQPLFSFINTDQWYVQANFNETDLRFVRPGNKVLVILRMYYFDKIFHGEIINNIWAADRQVISPHTQQQTVKNNNEWLNLPQRFPIQIKILDPDPKYPLNPGASAYVYVKT